MKQPNENEKNAFLDKLNNRENELREKNNQLWVQKANTSKMISKVKSPEVEENEAKKSVLIKEQKGLMDLNKKDKNERNDIEKRIKEKSDSMPENVKKQKGN